MKIMRILLPLLAVLLLTFGCRSQDEKIRDTLLNYAEAEFKYDAPYRAYLYLADVDKEHFTEDEYAGWSEARDERFGRSMKLEVTSMDQKPGRAEVTLTLEEPGEDPARRTFVLVENDDRWRVLLGLAQRTKIQSAIEKAKELLAEGKADEAQETLEKVAAEPFRASMPGEVEEKLKKAREIIEERARRTRMEKRFAEARELSLPDMAKEIAALESEITEEETGFRDMLVELRQTYEELRKKAAIEALSLEDARARTYKDYAWTVREIRWKLENVLNEPLAQVDVRIEFLADEETVHEQVYGSVSDGEVLDPGETVEFRREIENPPKGWEGKEIRAEIVDLKFAEEDEEGSGEQP